MVIHRKPRTETKLVLDNGFLGATKISDRLSYIGNPSQSESAMVASAHQYNNLTPAKVPGARKRSKNKAIEAVPSILGWNGLSELNFVT